MQSSCNQSNAFNQRKEDVGNYTSVKVKHITQTQEIPKEPRFTSSFADCQSLIGDHRIARNISRIELTRGGIGVRFFFLVNSSYERYVRIFLCVFGF